MHVVGTWKQKSSSVSPSLAAGPTRATGVQKVASVTTLSAHSMLRSRFLTCKVVTMNMSYSIQNIGCI